MSNIRRADKGEKGEAFLIRPIGSVITSGDSVTMLPQGRMTVRTARRQIRVASGDSAMMLMK